jgi:hypothetical protein
VYFVPAQVGVCSGQNKPTRDKKVVGVFVLRFRALVDPNSECSHYK